MYFSDALTMDAPRLTRDGYMAVRAKAARIGSYAYSGREVDPDNKHGLRDQAVVHVARDEQTVFDTRAVHSFIGKPVTNDHPRESVTAQNWKDHARGTIMGAKWEEGGYLAFDLMITDAVAIDAVRNGKRELSNGYGADLEFGDFTASDGVACQARQTKVTGNHVAIVDRGRAGSECRIIDIATCDSAPQSFLDSLEKPVKTMLIDGLTVDISNADTAESTIKTLLAARDEAKAKTVEQAAAIVTKDAEIVKLTKAVEDAKVTPQMLRDAAKTYAVVIGKAKAKGITVTDAMDEAAAMRAVVDKEMGEDAKAYTDADVVLAFNVLTKDVKVADAPNVLQDAIKGMPLNVGDAATVAATALNKSVTDLNAWRAA